MASNALPDALAILATSFDRDGLPIQSIHFLQALIAQQLPPDFEAKARLRLGRLLLEHTYNLKDASTHLLRAQMLVRGLIGNYCLKYEVHDTLATCFQYLKEDTLELQVYSALADLWKSARGSSEWPAVCDWVCRLAQRTVALHARVGRATDAERVNAEGLAFAEAHGLLLQRMVFLLASLQLSLARWDHPVADRNIAVLNSLISDPAAAAAAAAATAGAAGVTAAAGAASGSGGQAPSAPALDPATYQALLLHFNLLQVLYMLRLGKVTDLTKVPPQQQQQQQQKQPAAQGQEAGEASGAPPPPVLNQLETTLSQLKREARTAQQPREKRVEGQGQVPLPYDLPGLPSLEPLMCLVCASALRTNCNWSSLTERYLQRGLACTTAQLASYGLRVDACDAHAGGAAAAAGSTAEPAAPETELLGESSLQPQLLGPVRPALVLHVLLLECWAQIMMSKAKLRSAREEVLCCQRLMELFPGVLAPLRPGVQLLTGQYCVATGETATAVVHFQLARQQAASRPAAALAAVLEAEAHLAKCKGAAQPDGQQQEQQAEGAGLAGALAALGPFYTDIHGAAPGGGAAGGNNGPPGSLGCLEEAACLMASATCLAQQGQLAPANQLLTRALKTAHRRLGHTQLVCAILNELAPTFLTQNDTHSARESITSAITFSQTAGDLWAEVQGKRLLATVLQQSGEEARAAGMAASADRRLRRIAEAAAEAAADSGRHGFATYWGLRAVG